MARIRTIKPEFFRHEGLFEAEHASGLPLRIAFAGLWTAADREGRFKWKPRELKLDCLPHDEVDFSRVLDALVTRGFIVRYEVEGREYGFIPSWNDHQIINNRELASSLPAPSEINILTRDARVGHATATPLKLPQGEGKGKEGKGREVSRRVASAPCEKFEEFWRAYPRREGDNPRKPAEKKFNALVKTGLDPEIPIVAVKQYAVTNASKVGTQYIPQAVTWLNQERWSDHAAVAALSSIDGGVISIEDAVKQYASFRKWPRGVGPEPGLVGCKASAELLAAHGLRPDGGKISLGPRPFPDDDEPLEAA